MVGVSIRDAALDRLTTRRRGDMQVVALILEGGVLDSTLPASRLAGVRVLEALTTVCPS
jgi:hypothetical protein